MKLHQGLVCLSVLILLPTCILGDRKFEVYWNIPTFMCPDQNKTIMDLNKKHGVIQNTEDLFRGDKISLLYHPGAFPAITRNKTTNTLIYENGGVPQAGNLSLHLKLLEKDINEQITDKNFSGLAVIDFELWRPIFRQNGGSLSDYQNLSLKLEKDLHPEFNEDQLRKEAERRIEKFGRSFIKQTLIKAKKLRPKAQWGYYAFPYCFNGRRRYVDTCIPSAKIDNDRILYMFENSDVIYPAVYLQTDLAQKNQTGLVKGRVDEAVRMAKMVKKPAKPPVLVYHRYVFTDTLEYISKENTTAVFKAMKDNGADGVIIWGSSFDLNSKEKCAKFLDYLREVLWPVIDEVKRS
uniref:Hyaluronidase Tab y 2.0101 n=1 Tax=Tabanus yao TaxID=485572 RepID=HUGA_TABYA|nr:RecName: Full=Hyaluronidase Tab y 2.0101; AltName: Full=Allergen Tab a 2; AltName: Allergen=Tab y 2.0101; Flags: Precursor [Tabanus yao]ADM18346.1 putative Tab y 2 allergen [Tabanus yao]